VVFSDPHHDPPSLLLFHSSEEKKNKKKKREPRLYYSIKIKLKKTTIRVDTGGTHTSKYKRRRARGGGGLTSKAPSRV
jgi:hypothetical protein